MKQPKTMNKENDVSNPTNSGAIIEDDDSDDVLPVAKKGAGKTKAGAKAAPKYPRKAPAVKKERKPRKKAEKRPHRKLPDDKLDYKIQTLTPRSEALQKRLTGYKREREIRTEKGITVSAGPAKDTAEEVVGGGEAPRDTPRANEEEEESEEDEE